LSTFYNANYLEESMSYLERTAKKLLPILNEVKKRMIPEKQKTEAAKASVRKGKYLKRAETLESANENVSDLDDSSFILNMNDMEDKLPTPDMKNILGYLN
jgi:hypothetical protein